MTSPAGQEELRKQIDDAFELAKKAVEEVKKYFQEVAENLSSWKVALIIPPPVMLWIREQMKKVGEHIKKLIDLVVYAVEHHLPVISLIVQSFNWLVNVKAPMSDLSAAAGNPRQGNDNFYKWSGDARSAYDRRITDQRKAIDAVTANADFISAWLFKIVEANVKYMVELADFAAKMAGKIAKAAADTGTVINIPFAIDTLADQIGDVVEQGMKMLVDVGERFVQALGNVREITAVLTDHTNFPESKWPQAVTG
jgi:methyl-accepting chemotaxis protein